MGDSVKNLAEVEIDNTPYNISRQFLWVVSQPLTVSHANFPKITHSLPWIGVLLRETALHLNSEDRGHCWGTAGSGGGASVAGSNVSSKAQLILPQTQGLIWTERGAGLEVSCLLWNRSLRPSQLWSLMVPRHCLEGSLAFLLSEKVSGQLVKLAALQSH